MCHIDPQVIYWVTKWETQRSMLYIGQTLNHLRHTHLRSLRIIFCPDFLELIQVLGSKNWPITCQIIKVVHNYSHKQVDDLRNSNIIYIYKHNIYILNIWRLYVFQVCIYQKSTQHVETHKIYDGKVGSTGVFLPWLIVWLGITPFSIHAGQHDLMPRLPSSAPARQTRDSAVDADSHVIYIYIQ